MGKRRRTSFTHWAIELHVELIHYRSEEWSIYIFSNSFVKTFDMLTEGIAHEKHERFTEGACEVHAATKLVGPFRIRISEIVTSDKGLRLPSTCLSRLISLASRVQLAYCKLKIDVYGGQDNEYRIQSLKTVAALLLLNGEG